MRSDTDTCPKSEGGGHWVYWLSKLEYGNDCDANIGSQDEWGFRKYNLDSGESWLVICVTPYALEGAVSLELS